MPFRKSLPLAVLLLAVFFNPKSLFAEPINSGLLTEFVQNYCLDCHSGDSAEAQLNLESFDAASTKIMSADWQSLNWEKMVRRLSSRQMPPSDAEKPSEEEYHSALGTLVTLLDERAKKFPTIGKTDSIRRMTRSEYKNAIRDLFDLEIDVEDLLPADPSSHGFDNITVGELSPTLLNRYINAAELISRRVVGRAQQSPAGKTVRIAADLTQERHIDGLPLGTRGGTQFPYTFVQSGDYEFQIRLARDRDEKVEGLDSAHEIDILIDRKRMHRFDVTRPRNNDYTNVDAKLKVRIPVEAGKHQVAVTFPSKDRSLLEIKRQPFDASFNRHRHPRKTPAIFEVSIVGPFDASQTVSKTSRPNVFSCWPSTKAEESSCGQQIIRELVRQAYRTRPTDEDLSVPLRFFEQTLAKQGFQRAIEEAIASILVNPHFLFRVESANEDAKPGEIVALNDTEIASRLSFFLWSSVPDGILLELAEAGQLHDPDVLKTQVQRMLQSGKSESLAKNFASQWLHLRNLDSATPDMRKFPDFDDNLRQSFGNETELLFDYVVKNDLSVLELIRSDYSFLNQRLAKHYGVPGVYGSHFRKVNFPKDSHRGGLLRHGSILTVTSYATRTSPTIRGNWILTNIVGTPPPPPPPNVPALKDKKSTSGLTVRQRLAEHRANPACAACHDLIDPVGFALENFDAVGRWRDFEDSQPIDTSGVLPDGSEIDSLEDLEKMLLERPEMFATALTEKLYVYALGRGIEPTDGPYIRRIVDRAEQDGYRFSAIVQGIVTSEPFLKRMAE